MIFLFTHFFLLKQRNLSLHIMYSLHAAFPSGKCKIKEGRSHVAIFWAEFHPEYSTIGVLSGPHEMLIYICLYSSKHFAVIDLNFRSLPKYVPCGPSMADCQENSGVHHWGFRQVYSDLECLGTFGNWFWDLIIGNRSNLLNFYQKRPIFP